MASDASVDSVPPSQLPSARVEINQLGDSARDAISVALPDEVLAAPPLWSSCVIGHFLGDAPNIALVHATVNRVWNYGKTGSAIVKIGVQFITKRAVIFRIPNETLRKKVLDHKFWHVSSIPLVVQVWSPSTANAQPDMSNIPLWVDFTGVPDNVFSEPGLRFLSNQVGVFSKLHPNTERCVKLDVARTLVVMNLNQPLATQISIEGVITPVKVSYLWLPDHCANCQSWGHSAPVCGGYVKDLPQVTTTTTREIGLEDRAHVVPPLREPADLLGATEQTSHVSVPPHQIVDTEISATTTLKDLLLDLNAQVPARVPQQQQQDPAQVGNQGVQEGWTDVRKPSNRSSPRNSLKSQSPRKIMGQPYVSNKGILESSVSLRMK